MRGFEGTQLTPYFHLIATHAASMVRDIGGLDHFSGEKLDKPNDHLKRVHMRQTNSNHIKAPILTQKRREVAARAQSIRKHIHLHWQAMSQSRAAKSHTVALEHK